MTTVLKQFSSIVLHQTGGWFTWDGIKFRGHLGECISKLLRDTETRDYTVQRCKEACITKKLKIKPTLILFNARWERQNPGT